MQTREPQPRRTAAGSTGARAAAPPAHAVFERLKPLGNHALAQALTRARPARAPRALQRLVQIHWEQDPDSQDDLARDDATRTITHVEAVTTSSQTNVEGKSIGQRQRHVTAHTVYESALKRALEGKTVFGAWEALERLYEFLRGISDVWKTDGPASKATDRTVFEQNLDAQAAIIKAHRAKEGKKWRATTTATPPTHKYFKDEPTAADADPATHVIRAWKVNLDTETKALASVADVWLAQRNLLAWTSLEGTSHTRGEQGVPDKIAQEVAAHAGAPALPADTIKAISAHMHKLFDFVPLSFNQKRPLETAGWLAARHVVEHLQYYPSIPAASREPLRDRFFDDWPAAIKDELARHPAPEAHGKKRKADDSPLAMLLANWYDVRKTYEAAYAALVTKLK